MAIRLKFCCSCSAAHGVPKPLTNRLSNAFISALYFIMVAPTIFLKLELSSMAFSITIRETTFVIGKKSWCTTAMPLGIRELKNNPFLIKALFYTSEATTTLSKPSKTFKPSSVSFRKPHRSSWVENQLEELQYTHGPITLDQKFKKAQLRQSQTQASFMIHMMKSIQISAINSSIPS